MIRITAYFDVDTDNQKVAYTLVDAMLKRGWDEPFFRDRRIHYAGADKPVQIKRKDHEILYNLQDGGRFP